MRLTEPPLALYIHIPWCVRKCPYCDFNSHPLRGPAPEQQYVTALLSDLDSEAGRAAGRKLVSIFIGGGTPSLFSGAAIAELLDGVRTRLTTVSDLEITLESNPGSVTLDRLRAYREAGVNRLSIGVQSMRDEMLSALGRIHSSDEAVAALHAAREAGFDNINLDLMFGLPEDDRLGALHDLRAVTALAPEHLSWYQLAIEPNTVFHRHPPPLPDDDETWEAQQQGQRWLATQGYVQYEVSAYARNGRLCRHNLNYWTFGDYLGIGAGAHGKLSDVRRAEIVRRAKRKDPRGYMEHAGRTGAIDQQHTLATEEIVVEFMMNALRINDGFDLGLFSERTGVPAALIEPSVQEALQRGFIDVNGPRLRPSELGRRYLNELVFLFFPDDVDYGARRAAAGA